MIGEQGRTTGPTLERLFSISLLLLVVAAAPTPTSSASSKSGGEEAVEGFRGSLDVRLHPQGQEFEPPAEMLLTDPHQRRTGCDPRIAERFQEIPGSSYERESLADDIAHQSGPVTLVLYIANPVSGDYLLEVIGHQAGDYALEVQALDREMSPTRAEVVGARISAGSLDRYRIRYSNVEGAQVEVGALAQVNAKPAGASDR